MTIDVPFALDATLRTTCQVGIGAAAEPSDGTARIQATAGDFTVTLPQGYSFVPEATDAASAALAMLAPATVRAARGRP